MVRGLESAVMSVRTLLLTVEDLINMAMGPPEANTVNFKLVHTILHIIARHLRVLEVNVEISVTDLQALFEEREKTSKKRGKQSDSDDEATAKEKKGKSRGASKDRGKDDKDKAGDSKDRDKDDAAKKKDKEGREKKDKGERASAKDKEKADKASAKEEKPAAKEKEKADKAAAKEKAKEEKLAAKSKHKEEKEAKADKEKEDKAAAKERKMGEKGKDKGDKGKGIKGKPSMAAGINVTEKQRDKQKVLVVGKGPSTRTDSKGGGIDLVSVSQFELLEGIVKELAKRAGKVSTPSMPESGKLRSDLAKGTASFTDTMQAMQVNARVQAAEQGISQMGELLTQLAAAGALPEDIASQVVEVKHDLQAAAAKSRMMLHKAAGPHTGHKTASTTSRMSMMSGAAGMNVAKVTHFEMDAALESFKNDLTRNIQMLTMKASTTADNAVSASKSIGDKLSIALGLDARIAKLSSETKAYSEQLSGFDAVLNSQLQGFQVHMNEITSEMYEGLKKLENVNNNAETEAVQGLTERYEDLVGDLGDVLLAHKVLTATQYDLALDFRNLTRNVDMLHEQKADQDEIVQGLKDKVDNCQLVGLLSETDFALTRLELEHRLEKCYDTFHKQNVVWMAALKELVELSETKAELIHLYGLREEMQQLLQNLSDQCYKLALELGDPKIAVATRQICRGATCAPCKASALMNIEPEGKGAPPRLPASRPHTIGAAPAPSPAAGEPCFIPPQPPKESGDRPTCLRWVGGSHTLISAAVTRQEAVPLEGFMKPMKKYPGHGTDGRLYKMEEEMPPCTECNKSEERVDGGGDRGEPVGDRARR